MGQTYDAEHITVTETDSFTWSDKPIVVLNLIDDDTCRLRNVVRNKNC